MESHIPMSKPNIPGRPQLPSIPSVKAMIPIGCLLDIPTGTYLKAVNDSTSLCAGLGILTAVVGVGNSFKTTIMRYMSHSAAARMGEGTYIDCYDTENNIQPWHAVSITNQVERKVGEDWISSQRLLITNASSLLGDAYFDTMKDFMIEKKKNIKKYMCDTPFLDFYNPGETVKIPWPNFHEVDSLSTFATSDVVKMQDDNSLGESGANTSFMRQGLQKSRFVGEIPNYATATYDFFLFTAHFGEKIEMDPRNPSMKTLQHVKQGQRIKGVPPNFTYLMDNCWQTVSTIIAKNKADNTPLYPRDQNDRMPNDKDLNEVTLRQLRSKSGVSGIDITILVSQKDGVLPSLSEFHYLKTNKRWGLPGNDQHYECALLPGITLSRTTVRGLLDSNPKLRRAINILSECLQMRQFWGTNLDYKFWLEPSELYVKIKEAGYDWDFILEHTRGWWTINDEDPQLELSTMDILRMAIGEYHPYWLEADKKTVKKEYAKRLKGS